MFLLLAEREKIRGSVFCYRGGWCFSERLGDIFLGEGFSWGEKFDRDMGVDGL